MQFSWQYYLPQRLSSWIIRHLMRVRIQWVKNALIKIFMKLYGVALTEAEIQDIQQFKCFNDFFTRALLPEARPISHTDAVMPADGTIAALGTLQHEQFLNAKGHHFTLDSLLADPLLAKTFANGQFITIYLSPKDYHRIHMPASGKLLRTIHVPGKLYSVSLKTAQQIPHLFAANERVIALFNTDHGKMAVIMVGAINVSSIETCWHGEYPHTDIICYQTITNDIHLNKGQEMGRFNMGSTVVVLFEANDNFQLLPKLHSEQNVRMGQPLRERYMAASLSEAS